MKRGIATKKKIPYYLHSLLSIVHDDRDVRITLDQILKKKQRVLVNQKNIRSVNGISLLGRGNIVIGDGTATLEGDEGDDEPIETPDQDWLTGGGVIFLTLAEYEELEAAGELEQAVYAIVSEDSESDDIYAIYVKHQQIWPSGNVEDSIFVVKDGMVCLKFNE